MRDFACDGGQVEWALLDIRNMGGINDDLFYPYQARYEYCRFNKDFVVIKNSGMAKLPKGDEEALKKVVAIYGPVSVGIDVIGSDFVNYSSGVFYSDDCNSKSMNHAVLVVGYGTDPKGGDYWLVVSFHYKRP